MGSGEVTFKTKCETQWGESLLVVGSCDQLGSWKPDNAPVLDASAYPVWSKTVSVPANQRIEYKYVVRKAGAPEKWENCFKNRELQIPAGSSIVADDGPFGSPPAGPWTGSSSAGAASKAAPTQAAPAPTPVPAPAPRQAPSVTATPAPTAQSRPTPTPAAHADSSANAAPTVGAVAAAAVAAKARTNTVGSPFADLIAKENRERKSWQEKMQFVREVFASGSRSTVDTGDLSFVAVYLYFLSAGLLSSQNDSRVKPNETASSAKALNQALAQMSQAYPDNVFLLRRMYLLLPAKSVSSSEAVNSVPLTMTRIHDIALRNDIPTELKTLIRRLTEKLDRGAGPEDYATAQRILERMSAPGMVLSQSLVDEFRKFHAELKEFFFATRVEERLQALISQADVDAKGADILRGFLASKSSSQHDLLQTLRALTACRMYLWDQVSAKPDAAKDSDSLLRLRVAEIMLEDYAFVVLSEITNHLSAEEYVDWQSAIEVLALATRNAALSGVQPEECKCIENEFLSFLSVIPALSDPRKQELTRLKATVERTRRLAEDHSDKVLDLFTKRAQVLGPKVGVTGPQLRAFKEAVVRSHLIFQLIRLVSMTLKWIREVACMPPWDALVRGIATGWLVKFDNIKDLDMYLRKDTSDDKLVLLLGSAEGDEEIPPRVTGLVLAHQLPYLCDLAVRARQDGVVFAICDDLERFSELTATIQGPPGKRSQYVTLSVPPDSSVTLQRTDPPAHGTAGGHITANRFISSRHTLAGRQHTFFRLPDTQLVGVPKALKLQDVTLNIAGPKAEGAKKLDSLSKQSLEASGPCQFRTASGLVIPFGVFEMAIGADPQVSKEYADLVSRIDGVTDTDTATKLAHQIRAVVRRVPVFPSLVSEIVQHFDRNDRLMFRSSSNCEDLEEISGAGLHDSIANVAVSEVAIADAIRTVWASLWTRRAVLSRIHSHIKHDLAHMAIFVQETLPAAFSFIMTTTNPISHNPQEVYVEVALGMGEILTSGAIAGSPYRLVIRKAKKSLSMSSLAALANLSTNDGLALSGMATLSEVKTLGMANYSYKLELSDSAWKGFAASGTGLVENGTVALDDKETATGKRRPNELGLVRRRVDYSKADFSMDERTRQLIGRKLGSIGAYVEDKMGMGALDVEGVVVEDDVFLVQARAHLERSSS